ncbi:DUF3995 domain-containing protein [Ensifer adhaerens]|uniref:DUF3995 domain-containing protein n=1 Tax=Ensifer adhaerens TaxID=106592 RepID=UPI000FD8496A|nr:DUF3995 domain-containing protein [Ensifer adhaerens]MDF8353595.1 DUF3995 domain-containing protein [Ensifer adhaerens]THA64763.1 DUF3995 domain-containing protein [Ensifer adhaerens]
MLAAIAILLFLVLSGIAGLHAYWAFGGLWPCDDEETLVRTVVGTKHRSAMPPVWLTLVVVVLLFAAALLPLSVTPVFAGLLPPSSSPVASWPSPPRSTNATARSPS